MSSNVHTALSSNDWHPDLANDSLSQCLQGDPNIDDPVNDTGLDTRCGDFQPSRDCCQVGQILKYEDIHDKRGNSAGRIQYAQEALEASGLALSERAWGAVLEDYSPHENAWEYLPHDHARSHAYRWNEDGLAGFSDRRKMSCFALALWNERDPILMNGFSV